MTFIKSGLVALGACCFAGLSNFAAEKLNLDSLNWVKGPATGKLKNIAEIKVPVGCMLTDSKGAQTLLEGMGNPTSGSELGFFAPTSLTWFVVFEFSEVGYIKDDDKDKLDPDAMLKSIRSGNEQANSMRKKMGVPALNIVGWEQPPKYNPVSNNLEWAIRAESEGDPVVNYNTRLLGRKGVMELNLVIDPADLAGTLPDYQMLLNGFSFSSGQRYAEYRSGDKLAQFGLAALVTGGAAAVAVKTGLFASLILLVKKAWKLLVLVVVGAVAFVRKLILGGKAPARDAE